MNKTDIQQAIDYEIAAGEKKFGTEFKIIMTKILCLQKELSPENKPTRLIPLSEWNKYHDYPSKGSLYQYSMNKENNGFEDCIEYGGEQGGRILIDEAKFFEWHRNKNKKSPLDKARQQIYERDF